MTFLRIAWRNLTKRPRYSIILLLAIASGLFALLVYLAMLDGFFIIMTETLIDTSTGHIQIHRKNYLLNNDVRLTIRDSDDVLKVAEKNPHVTGISPRVIGQGLVSSAESSNFASVYGIIPRLEANVTTIIKDVVKGEMISAGDEHSILIGESLGEKLKVDVGDKVVVMVHDKKGEMSGVAFRVKGMYRTASKEYDRTNLYVPINAARKMLGLEKDETHEIAIRVDNSEYMNSVSADLGQNLRSFNDGKLMVETWKELEPVMAQQIDMSRSYNYIMFLIVYIALAFGIINAFMMEIFDRIREFGIMMSLGTRPSQIFLIIFFEALLLGLIGSMLGIIFSFLVINVLMGGRLDVSVFARGMQFMGIGSVMPLIITWQSVVQTYAGTTLAVILAALYPALKAAFFKPVEALRHV